MKNKFVCTILLFTMLVGSFLPITKVYGSNLDENIAPVTWDPNKMSGNLTLSNDNLDVALGAISRYILATESRSSGKWYWELQILPRSSSTAANPYLLVGATNLVDTPVPSNPPYAFRISHTGRVMVGESSAESGNIGRIRLNHIIGIGVDLDNNILKIMRDDDLVFESEPGQITFTDGIYPFAQANGSSGNFHPIVRANFGETPFVNPIPEGYLPYNNTDIDTILPPITNPSYSILRVLLQVDETTQLSVSNNLTDNLDLLWSSSDESVAIVDEIGTVTAVGEGTAEIWAVNEETGYEDYIPVIVVSELVEINSLRLALHLLQGEGSRLYMNGNENVSWNSLSPDIVNVDNYGRLTALSPGLAIVTSEHNGYLDTIYVRVV